MADRKPRSFPWIGVVVLAVLLGGYVEVYYATVYPLPDPRSSGKVFAIYGMSRMQAIESTAGLGVWTRTIRRVFVPMNMIDRRIRRSVWEPKP
ncbi:MAG: hypothetical protein IT428_17445 [Planctomycetaceae bacterium]|nr:hypothetical protein [Planctomycetaceae bacterium]